MRLRLIFKKIIGAVYIIFLFIYLLDYLYEAVGLNINEWFGHPLVAIGMATVVFYVLLAIIGLGEEK